MPIYEFRCKNCGSLQEAIRPSGDSGADLTCEACGKGALEKVPSTFATHAGGRTSSAGSCGTGGFN